MDWANTQGLRAAYMLTKFAAKLYRNRKVP